MFTRSGFKFQVSSSKLKAAPGAFSTSNSKPQTSNLKLRKSLGLTLVELIVTIVIISTVVGGVLSVLNLSTQASAEPLFQKQALSIAEALLEEAQLMPFTYCDPDDANAETALNAGACAATAEAIGPEALDAPPTGPAETRAGTVRPFDNVNDYHGFNMAGISDIEGTPITGLGAYSATVSVAGQALGAIGVSESQLITVIVTGPANVNVRLDGYRVRYAPNLLP